MRLVFGGAIALILLVLYIFCVSFGLMVAFGFRGYSPADFHSGYSSTLSLIGGLVSALVIAELAVTKPGETPIARNLDPASAAIGENVLNWVGRIAWFYVFCWILFGLATFVVGTLLYPTRLQVLTDHGQAWLGLAVTASYAYFGLNQK
jgi:hypothetical protein